MHRSASETTWVAVAVFAALVMWATIAVFARGASVEKPLPAVAKAH